MSLNYPGEPDNAPKDAQFYGPETDDFVAGWYKYKNGQWYWTREARGSEAEWEEVGTHDIPTLGTDIFLTKKYPLDTLEPDAEYLYHATPNTQLRRDGDTGYVHHPRKSTWRKLGIFRLGDTWWSYQIPLADLGWKPCSPSSATTPENDVDNW